MKIKHKRHKNAIKRQLKFQDYKNCLEAVQIDNKKNHLEKNKFDIDSPTEFIRNNKLVLKIQRFKSESHKVLIEEIKKIALRFYDDKIIQSIDSTETYAHGTSKDLVFEKEETKCNYIIKQLKNFYL